MVRRKISIPEPLAAVVANQRLHAASFLRIYIYVGGLLIPFVGLGISKELVEGGVLILLQPFDCLVDCGEICGG